VEAETFEFGSFHLQPERRLLLDQGKAIRLGSRALDILTILVEAAGQTVGNSQIMARAWPSTTLDEGSLRVHIAALRKALGDGRGGNRFILNLPGRGYSFVAPVTRRRDATPAPAPEPPKAAAASNLPAPLVNIVGRADTIAGLAAQLARRRLLTVVGAGGIGKTTVAIAVAEAVAGSYPDGVWFVALATLPASGLVSSAVGAALGIAATGPDPLPGLAAWLRDKQALLVLDNCEHVVDAAAVLAETILKAAPRVSILATSREPLRAEGESLLRLTPLETPAMRAEITASEALEHAAVQLFAERAFASDGQFRLTDADAPAVCEICRRLDGLPLALELAAAQVEVFGSQGIAQGLHDRFALLARGRRTALRRQQTLRATMDWSYDLLPEVEKIVLRRLAVFRGEFTMDAAQAIVGEQQIRATDVVDSVATLAIKSLVASDINSDVTYYNLLETTRAYALEKLAGDPGAEQLRRRHADYYSALLASAEDREGQAPQTGWPDWYRRHIDNVRTGLDWAFSPRGDAGVGVALTIAAVPLWNRLSLFEECRERAEQALATLDDDTAASARQRMRLSAALGWALMYGVGRAREAGAAWQTTLELAERLDDTQHRQHALWGLCIDQFNNGNVRTALDFAQRFAALVGGSTDPIELMMADRIVATAHHYLGDQRSARRHIDRALAREAGLARRSRTISAGFDLLVSAHYFQARILWLQGFAAQAMRVVQYNIEEGRAAGQALSFCSVLGQGACPIAFLAGDLDAAEQYGAMLIEHTERYPVRLWNIWARCFLGLVATRRGDVAGGLQTLRAGLAQAGEARFLPRFMLLQGEQAQYLGSTGEADAALRGLDQMLARSEAREENWYVPELLRIRGELLLLRDGRNASAAVETVFRQSLDMAHGQGALSWELRTATSMARLWQGRGRQAEAGTLLRQVHGRFTEGGDTADLQAAKLLLDQLP
jgi:predicted ATPase/DNA-binding winged helix-turn-helix (wHTH) protein